MNASDSSGLGRLGQRTQLDPTVPATLRSPAGSSKGRKRRFGRSSGPDASSRTGIPVELVDYSVTGIGFTKPEHAALTVKEMLVVELAGTTTNVRVVGSHPGDGGTVWGAKFMDPRPELMRIIEETALHRDIAGDEARWNDQFE